MVTHIVIFSWIPGVAREQVERFRQALDHLASELSGLGEFVHGPDLAFRDGNGDYALIARFEDQSSWNAYLANPKHKAFVADVVVPLQASRLTIQF